MTPRGLRSTARIWFWFILGGTLLGTVIAFGLAAVTPPGYTAHVILLVTPAPKATGITNSDLQVAQAITPTFAELATTRPVLDRVIASTRVATDAESLGQSVTTHVPVGTSLLSISVSNRDAAAASALANAIAAELLTYAPPGGSNASAALQVELTVVDPATPPTTRDGPAVPVRTALGGAIGLFLTASIAFLVQNTWPQSREALRRSTQQVAPLVSPSLLRTPDDASETPDRADPTRRNATATGYDPLVLGAAAPDAQNASTRVSNELINDLRSVKVRRLS